MKHRTEMAAVVVPHCAVCCIWTPTPTACVVCSVISCQLLTGPYSKRFSVFAFCEFPQGRAGGAVLGRCQVDLFALCTWHYRAELTIGFFLCQQQHPQQEHISPSIYNHAPRRR